MAKGIQRIKKEVDSCTNVEQLPVITHFVVSGDFDTIALTADEYNEWCEENRIDKSDRVYRAKRIK